MNRRRLSPEPNSVVQSNTIAFNASSGVAVLTSTGTSILGNSIHSNGELGIELNEDGVTLNDPPDADSGPNNLQNFPTITTASSSGGSTTISGTLISAASATFNLEFFATSVADPTGFGEGESFLGATSVATDASGNVSFTVNLATTVLAPRGVCSITASMLALRRSLNMATTPQPEKKQAILCRVAA